MIDARFKKSLGDLWTRKGRTLITLAGLFMGLTAVFTVAIAFRILSEDLVANYLGTTPPAITFDLKAGSGFDLAAIRALPEVTEVENRPEVFARYTMGPDRYLPVILFVVDDFEAMSVATVTRQTGSFPPAEGAVLLERGSEAFSRMMRLFEARGGPHATPLTDEERRRILSEMEEKAFIRFRDGSDVSLPIGGTVHDPGRAPSQMEQMLYGYVSAETAATWSPGLVTPRIIVALDPANYKEAKTRAVAAKISKLIEEAGGTLESTGYPSPVEHPHQFQLNSILFLLASLGGLGLASCTVLVVNLKNSILSSQIRQIGVLKAIGASLASVRLLYLGSMGFLGLVASSLALWQGDALGRSLSAVISAMLNFNILTLSLSPLFYGGLLIAGIAFPVMVAAVLIRRWTNLTVRAALDAHGVSEGDRGGELLAGLRLPLPLFVQAGIRNAFRRPARTMLTAATLGIGLMAFVVAMNVRSSLLYTSEVVEESMRHELQVSLGQDVSPDQIKWIPMFSEVDRFELWSRRLATWVDGDGIVSAPFLLSAVPEGSRAIKPNIMAGTWLVEGTANAVQENGVVVNQRFLDRILKVSEYPVGENLTVQVGGEALVLRVTGVVKEFGGPALYVTEAFFRDRFGGEGMGNAVLVSLRQTDLVTQSKVKVLLEQHFDLMDVPVLDIRGTQTIVAVVENHLDVIGYMLGVVAVLMLAVSGLGMASAVTAATVERTRELGVLKAVGGRAGAITVILVTEALMIVFIAWGLAALLSPDVSRSLTAWFGDVIAEYPFDYRTDRLGLGFALGTGVLLAVIASAVPVRMALTRRVRDALGYE
jgi:putative ABC transport system permease protein